VLARSSGPLLNPLATSAIASRVVHWHICQGDPACDRDGQFTGRAISSSFQSTSATIVLAERARLLEQPPREEGITMTTPDAGHRHSPELLPHRLLRRGQVHHPAVLDEARRRREDFQLRIADRITSFAGSMNFVWIHAALFTVWMLLLERNPWPTLALVVSLEAIFLSAFVMIGQNRQSAFQQAKADHDFEAQELELKTNTELTRQIHVLTQELHRRIIGAPSEHHNSMQQPPA
jgi:uncharacterized membrane protein